MAKHANLKIHAMPGHLIRRMQQISGRVFASHAKAAGVDLTSVQFAALDAIRANPGIDQAGVSELIAYDRPTIGGVIDRLEMKGLIERRVSRTDRRAREITLTDAGDRLYLEFSPVVVKLQSRVLRGLDAEERKTFIRLAKKIIES